MPKLTKQGVADLSCLGKQPRLVRTNREACTTCDGRGGILRFRDDYDEYGYTDQCRACGGVGFVYVKR